MKSSAPFEFAPVASVALIGLLLALGPLAWVWRRYRRVGTADRSAARLQALAVLTLCLTFDLVLFGAFTRLTDSGLGCPDWPGCYGSASPWGAHAQIGTAQIELPDGPVTHAKAWIEMIHRYLATGVGALIVVLASLTWLEARKRMQPVLRVSRWWAAAALVWVCVQGAFGAFTVTLKLYPAVVTAHLLGGLVLLMLLAVLTSLQRREPPLALSPGLYRAALALAALSFAQMALGGWVSTNYAVTACGSDFPMCLGSWWPRMDFAQGFALRRELGAGVAVAVGGGGAGSGATDGVGIGAALGTAPEVAAYLPFAALTAIHYAHRLGAYVVLVAMVLFAWRLHASGDARLRGWARGTAALALWQLVSGLSNVVLGWPLLGAVAHTAGAAAWITLLALLITRARLSRGVAQARTGPALDEPAGAAGTAKAAAEVPVPSLGRFFKMRSSNPP